MTDSEKLDQLLAQQAILVAFVQNFGGPRIRDGDGSKPTAPATPPIISNPILAGYAGSNPLPPQGLQPVQPAPEQPGLQPSQPPLGVNRWSRQLDFVSGSLRYWNGPAAFALTIPAGWKGTIHVTAGEAPAAGAKVDQIDLSATLATGEVLAHMEASSMPIIDFPVAVDQAATIFLNVTPHTPGGGMIEIQLS